MNIWTSNRSRLFLLIGLSLAACDPGGKGFSLLQSDAKVDGKRRDVALSSTELMGGTLKLTPADGFCVDKRSVKKNFAVMARCDSLGSRQSGQDADLGMVLVAVTSTSEESASDPALIVPDTAQILEERQTSTGYLVKLKGEVPDGADNVHWRGVDQIGTYLVSATAYAPNGGPLSGEDGAKVVKQTLERADLLETIQAPKDAIGTATEKKKSWRFLSSLFE